MKKIKQPPNWRNLDKYERFSLARGVGTALMPYFRPVFLKLVPIFVDDESDIPEGAPAHFTAAVSAQGHLWLNTQALADMKLEQWAFIVAHEAAHLFLHTTQHADRLGLKSDTQGKWILNLASDAVINDLLEVVGMQSLRQGDMPRLGGLSQEQMRPDSYDPAASACVHRETFNIPAEFDTLQAYQFLRARCQIVPGIPGKSMKASIEAHEEIWGELDKKKPVYVVYPGVAAGDCGSGAGQDSDFEDELAGRPDTPEGHDQGSMDRARTAAAKDVLQSDGAKGLGSAAAEFLRWAKACVEEPRIRWQDHLKHVLSNASARVRGAAHMTYARRSKLQAGLGTGAGRPVLGQKYQNAPNIMVVFDTSGSMGDEELGQAVKILDQMLDRFSSVEFLANDAGNQGATRVASLREAQRASRGGGGTDFRPVFEAAAALPRYRQPGALVFVTDGGGPGPATNPLPRTKVIWVLVGAHAEFPWKSDTSESVDFGVFIRARSDGSAETVDVGDDLSED